MWIKSRFLLEITGRARRGVSERDRDAGRHSGLARAWTRAWAAQAGGLEWIDLQVIRENRAAVALYRRAGFTVAGEIEDMFRIDGKSYSYTTMNLRIGAE